MPGTWGHCRRSCSLLSATNQPQPAGQLLILQSPGGNRKHAYVPATACACESADADGRQAAQCAGRNVDFTCFTSSAAVHEAVNLAVVHTLMYAYEGGWGVGGLPAEVIVVDCFFFCSLHIHHAVNWIQLLLWSASNLPFELSVSVRGTLTDWQKMHSV